MPPDDQRVALREVIKGVRSPMPETLVRLCCQSKDNCDRAMLTLAFEALTKRATRLLLSQAWGVSKDERLDHVQDVLIKVFVAIQSGKADFACRCFAAFTRRRAIELYRARKSTWEESNQREELGETDDPLEHLPSRASGPEFRALISIALEKLPPKHAEAFVQYHHYGLTQAEIATHHSVSDRTVRIWLDKDDLPIGTLNADGTFQFFGCFLVIYEHDFSP